MNEPSPHVARKRSRVRQEILITAQDLLREGGAHAVTLASVASRLGVSKQAIYHYFPSKEAMIRALITSLLDDEIETLIAAVEKVRRPERVLGEMIRAFHAHYTDRLDAFRTIYCQAQLYSGSTNAIDETTLRDEIHPRTRKLFELLEEIIAGKQATRANRNKARKLAFTAWTSALGLMTMIGVAEASDDPLVHSHNSLLDTLAEVFKVAPT